jgi:hypothetical protein
MADLNFPVNPSSGDSYTFNDRSWIFNGTTWKSQGITGYTGSAGPAGGYTGSQGDKGYTGSASTIVGYTGSAGAGYTGSFGYTGSGFINGQSITTNTITFLDNTQVSTGYSLGPRNKIINGDMRFDQRYSGNVITLLADGGYTVDRWKGGYTQANKLNYQQVTSPANILNGFSHSLKVTVSTAYAITTNDYFFLQQRIEGFNSSDLAWGTASAQPATLSFWVYSSVTGTYGLTVRDGGETICYPTSYTINAQNTWEKKTITINGPTSGGTFSVTNGIGMEIQFGLGYGSALTGNLSQNAWNNGFSGQPSGSANFMNTQGAVFYLTGVQFESGTVATPFERRIYPQELINCQRYYQQSFPIGTAPAQNISTCFYTFSTTVSNFVTGYPFQVPMRGTPNILTYNPYAANNSFRVPNSVTDVAVTTIASAVGIMYFTCTLAAPSGLHGNFTATAEL